MTETATAANPNEASASTETATQTTPVVEETVTQQTQTVETPATPVAEAVAETKTPEPVKVPVAPEKYEFKAPEGHEYDPGMLEAFSAAAKKADLSQDAAQGLIETLAPAIAARQTEQFQAAQAGWIEASRADKEFGGDKLTENLGVARKALDTFGTPELSTLLDTSGLGNHPEVIRFLLRAGKAISEDGYVGGRGAAAPSDGAKSFYPNSKMS